MGYILTKRAVESVSRRLNLSVTGKEQDWDIELADPTRLGEFLNLYKQAQDLDESERYALMALILASCDDTIQKDGALSEEYWSEIRSILQNTPIYHDLIDSWALIDEINEDDLWGITPYMRSLKVE